MPANKTQFQSPSDRSRTSRGEVADRWVSQVHPHLYQRSSMPRPFAPTVHLIKPSRHSVRKDTNADPDTTRDTTCIRFRYCSGRRIAAHHSSGKDGKSLPVGGTVAMLFLVWQFDFFFILKL